MQKVISPPLTFLDLGNKYVDWYLVGAFSETMIRDFTVIRECLCECYKLLTCQHGMLQIEGWPDDDITELQNECSKYYGALSEADRIKFIKAYAALSCLAQKRL